MKVYFKDVPSTIPDNERSYFNLLEGVLNSTDEFSTMEIRRNPTNYLFRISTSAPSYLVPIIQRLNEFHNMLGIRLTYSKSIKNSSALSFSILTFS